MDNGASSYRRYLDGDETAFAAIMETWFDKVLFFIDRYVHDLHTAEDIAMDVFADLVVHRHRYNFQYSFSSYLFLCARSRALNHLKRNKLIVFTELEEDAEDRSRLEDTVLQHEQHRALHRALSSLPLAMQEAVHLVYFEGLSYEDAAKAMKKNRKQIDNLLTRAKRELRTILGKEGVSHL